jgi:hypothetical protein
LIPLYKLLLFLIIFGLVLLAGYSSFRFLNKKINASETGRQMLAYSLLLVSTCSTLFLVDRLLLLKSMLVLFNAE